MNLLEAMRYLAALEHHRHFGRAAQACHITQPALSNALRALVVDPAGDLLGQGGNDTLLLAPSDRFRRVGEPLARLDLDEHQQASAAGDDVDFADRALPTPRQDAKAFGDEKRRRPALG